MELRASLLIIGVCLIFKCHGFYKPKINNQISTHTPTTLDELKKLLCSKNKLIFYEGGCDSDPKKIIINKVFDFTNYEGTKTESGCRYDAFDSGCLNGLWMLKTAGGCGNKEMANVEYSVAGLKGLEVGSNKIIVGINGGGLKGKGLKLDKSVDVQIRNLAFTDINPHLYYGGSAIELIGAKNVLINENYFKNVGHMMVGSKGGSSTGVTISANFFDGNSPNSFHCDGRHRYVWLFAGEAEQIRLEHNSVHHTSGSALTVSAQKNTKTFVHLFQNVLYDVKHSGAINITNKESSVLAEGNVFTDLTALVDVANQGNLFMPQTELDEVACESNINRKCEMNTLVNVEGGTGVPPNSMQTLRDIKAIYDADAKSWANWLFGPSK